MADQLKVAVEPAELALEVGQGRSLRAMVTSGSSAVPDATYSWSKGRTTLGGDAEIAVVMDVDGAAIGTYTVSVSAGGELATASAQVTMAKSDPPAVWNAGFAVAAARWLGVGGAIVFLPAFVLAVRGVAQTWPRAVVGSLLVGAGLVALGASAFLILLDYRGRMAEAPSAAPAGHNRGLAVDEVGTAVAKILSSVSNALKGAVALLLAAVAIFWFAAWTAVGGNSGDRPGDEPTPAPSATSSASATTG